MCRRCPWPSILQRRRSGDREGKETAAAAEGITGKPANIVEKIIAGKLEKYFQEVTLVDQPFNNDDKQRIRDLLAETGKATGSTVTVVRFAPVQGGRGVSE